MKKAFAFVLIAALVLVLSPALFVRAAEVRLSNQRFSVDGNNVDLLAFNVDGYNYVMLRSLASVLSGTDAQFSVEFTTLSDEVRVTTGTGYTQDGDVNVTGAWESEPVRVNQPLLVDGVRVEGLSSWNIAGNNYFKLAELEQYLGYKMQYSDDTNTVMIVTDVENPSAEPLTPATSYLDVLRRVMAADEAGKLRPAEETAELAVDSEGAGKNVPLGAADFSDRSKGWSGTNVQTEGVDEGDIVKTDGQYIYVLNGEADLSIILANGRASSVLSHTQVGGYAESDSIDGYYTGSIGKYPLEMFVEGNTLAILSGCFKVYVNDSGWEYEEYTGVDFYDVSNPRAPALISSLGQEGALLASRLLDGKLYLTTSYMLYDYDAVNPATYVPRLYSDELGRAIPAESIWLCGDGTQYVVVGDYDIAEAALTDVQSLMGSGDTVYMSGSDLFVLGSVRRNEESESYAESVYTITEYKQTAYTEVFRFDLRYGGLNLAASGTVPGYIDNQFSADQYNGNLRIVTTLSEDSYKVFVDRQYGFTNYRWGDAVSGTGLYVLDSGLNQIGSLTGLAPDEEVYSVRFADNLVYFCTYRDVDPLFAVDLTNPASPQVLSALKLSGFSEYLHPWTSGKLFGFGRETDEETGRGEGLKLVMFDITDKTDVRVENSLVLDADYSEALRDHRAFFIDSEKNVIGFVGDGDYYLYSYDQAAGFIKLAHVAFDEWESSARGLWVGQNAYIVGSGMMAVLDMRDWSLTGTLDILV